MATRRRTITAGLFATMVTVGCGTNTVAAGDEIGSVTSGTETTADTAPRPGELTELARLANQQLGEDAERLGLTTPSQAPETWEATLTVDIELTDADLDDPLAALPHPFADLAPVVTELVVEAESPAGPTGFRLQAPFTGLRPELDGSNQVATTNPGDEPPATETWVVESPRIEKITLTVLDLDNVASVTEILDLVGPDRILLGRPGSWPTISLADARAGVAATLPPLTGTQLPSTPVTSGP